MARRRGRRRRVRRGPDGHRAPGARGRSVRPRGRAVHPDRVDGQRARARRPGRARAGGRLRVAGPHPAGRARRPRGADRPDQPHLGGRPGAGRPRRRSERCTRPTWGRSSCARPRCRSRTPTTSPAARCCRSPTSSSCARFADELGCAVHVDGARIWNAHVATGTPLSSYGAVADTMAVCLSKGLGAPIGSLMIGSADQVAEARVRRKRMGGGMRQVGVLAAAGLYALEHHVERLADDHEHARLLAEACGQDPDLTETNIVVVDVPDAPAVVAAAREQGVLVGAVGPTKVRAAHPPRRRPRRRRAGRQGAVGDPEDRIVLSDRTLQAPRWSFARTIRIRGSAAPERPAGAGGPPGRARAGRRRAAPAGRRTGRARGRGGRRR